MQEISKLPWLVGLPWEVNFTWCSVMYSGVGSGIENPFRILARSW